MKVFSMIFIYKTFRKKIYENDLNMTIYVKRFE